MIKVDVAELVAALKALKVHLKARRNLNLLIQRGDRPGQLILELSGRSKYSGMLTTITCSGVWRTDASVPAASFRGFVAHPPEDKTTYMSFHEGRLHLGTWSCPASEQ